MTYEEQYLLTTLKCFIYTQSPTPFKGDMEELIRITNKHFLMGILGYMMTNYPNDISAEQKAGFRKNSLKYIGYFANAEEKMKVLISQMNEAGIDHLLFKGFVVKDYYPVPELRTFGDIDFLIRKEDRKKSDELMIANGFQRKDDWEPVYSYKKEIEYYEIHTDVMEIDVSPKADYVSYFAKTWKRAVNKNEHTYVLPPEDHLIYLLTHLAKHINGSGAGIRMYLDIAAFLKHFEGQLDIQYLKQELETISLYNFTTFVFAVVQKYFEVNVPFVKNDISEETFEKYMEYTLEGGVFGKVERDSGLITLKQEGRDTRVASRKGERSRLRIVIGRLFPPAATIESRYTYLQGRHWLIPIAWVHRLFITRDKIGEHAKEARSIMNVDQAEVDRLKEIYEILDL
ncbi:MAG: nucleotidyltransferase family protein [Lachnospiraceae bacterium]|nr:nucleotidyltransferase family protein [Lachnospiraceae bacterium]